MSEQAKDLVPQRPQATEISADVLERVLLTGDLTGLASGQIVQYYNAVCDSLGLNKLTQPFAVMTFNGKKILYAKRDCTEQLRRVHKISVKLTNREKIGDVYVVTANARTPDNREDESTGAVALGRLQGEALANAYMKAETKSKRRVTLSICGLGLPDESEVEGHRGPVEPSVVTPEVTGVTAAVSEVHTPRELPPRTGPTKFEDPGEFTMPFGKDMGKTLKEMGPAVVRSRLNYFYGERDKGKQWTENGINFVHYAERYLEAGSPPLEPEMATEFAPAEDERFPFEK